MAVPVAAPGGAVAAVRLAQRLVRLFDESLFPLSDTAGALIYLHLYLSKSTSI